MKYLDKRFSVAVNCKNKNWDKIFRRKVWYIIIYEALKKFFNTKIYRPLKTLQEEVQDVIVIILKEI